MAPVQLEDPAVRRILDAVLPTENNPNFVVSEGLAGTESIGHIRAREIYHSFADNFEIPNVSLFLGSSGLELLKFASERRKAFEADRYSALTLGFVWIFVEIQAGAGALAHRVVKVVALPDVEESLAEEWIRDMRRALPGLPRALGMSHDEFYDRIDGALSDEYPSILGRGFDAIHEGLAEAFDLADKTAKEFATFLETNSRMPPGLWDPRQQPKDWADFLDGLKAEQTPILDRVEKKVIALQSGFLKRFAGMGRFLPNRLQAMLGRLSKMWNWLFGTIRGCIDLLRDMKPDLEETGAAVLGFVSGLWDGIMDAVIGFLEMLSLGFKLVAADLRLNKDFSTVFQTVLEFLETTFDALEKIDFDALWDWVQRAWPILWNAAWTRAEWAFDKVISNSAQSGYYFGYIVYMVIEFFLPPLKASSLLKNARRLASMKFFRQVLA
ncbi:hypothetical protein TRP8649_04621 [Pelagimonas phthalicica]|uniref:Uncharacterized protein n=1 Tax=Pelagimonas phthalicica TaxID=1037362 RepID=A0A238JJX7_9RHOB|nr:hypothetical protein [Pelagimonas phthalicica]TDS88391.1 hypothetical protein CLV87_4625 [Pelagimonas phthalicica]SMX30477.1 hypothetical protein TRP8649_04621 [Pelagimonas phthalicica]